MNKQDSIDTARALLADDKGLLAMDESNPTCNKRFAKLDIPQTEDARRRVSGIDCYHSRPRESISGAILYDETIRQKKKDGTPFREGPCRFGNHPRHQGGYGSERLGGPSGREGH